MASKIDLSKDLTILRQLLIKAKMKSRDNSSECPNYRKIALLQSTVKSLRCDIAKIKRKISKIDKSGKPTKNINRTQSGNMKFNQYFDRLLGVESFFENLGSKRINFA